MREVLPHMARRSSDSPTYPRGLLIEAPDYSIETEYLLRGARVVAGIDEAGRGPLAGPVVAAAVVLDRERIPKGLDDSKKLSAGERERLFAEIVATATVSVSSASAVEVDRHNIRGATLLAMRRALKGLSDTCCHVLIDGRDVPPGLPCTATAVVQGDARSHSIAAASIVAKVTRDRMMTRLCTRFPSYGFSRHMGYGTSEHLAALSQVGPCPYHRMTFSPLRQGRLDLV